tara:strand:+ start:438 stop:674 length:237 start_codon:yes stop_codon:yes gene_type:complete
MKLIKEYAGSYYGEDYIDGYDIKVEVESIGGRGFSFSIYVNDRLMYDDGWIGLTLREIKQNLDKWIDISINEYEDENY